VPVRAVLDTQVVLRGLLGARSSACTILYEALAQNVFVGVTSPHILEELRTVLEGLTSRGRYELTPARSTELLDAYQRIAQPVDGLLILRDLNLLPPIPVEDEPIVAAAIEADAEYVVTDDGGLLDVKAVAISGHRTIQIIAPGPFAKRVLGIEVSGQ
jgi:predicted nucleic acid-binding protein